MAREHRHADIAEWAYKLWEAEGRPTGRDMVHWLRAEAELSGKLPAPVEAYKPPASMPRPKKTKSQTRRGSAG